MTSLGTCLEPQCYTCEWNEYQESYTKESKCQLQPYCDTSETPQLSDIVWPGGRAHTCPAFTLFQMCSSKIPHTTEKRKLPACAKRVTTVPRNDVWCVKNTVAAKRDKWLKLKVSPTQSLIRNIFLYMLKWLVCPALLFQALMIRTLCVKNALQARTLILHFNNVKNGQSK